MTPDTFKELLDQAVRPRMEAIAAIWATGKIAVVFFEPTDWIKNDAAQTFGWDGSPLFPMPEALKQVVLASFQDEQTPAWLSAQREGRIFLVAHDGALFMIDHEPGKGFTVDIGAAEPEWIA